LPPARRKRPAPATEKNESGESALRNEDPSKMVAHTLDQPQAEPLGESGVGQTCLLIAGWRAREAEQIDPLFVDPIANIFVSPETAAWVDEVTAASVSTCRLIAYRTRYFDDYLRNEQQRGVKQVVLLGAGLDTRALRLGDPGVAFYEIDGGAVLAYKRAQLERHGYASASRFIAGDYLRDDWLASLRDHGFSAEAETYFIWEGNTMYLPAEAIVALLSRVRTEVPRARISFDYVSEDMIRRQTGFVGADQLVSGFEQMGAAWVTGFAEIGRVADRAGLRVVESKLMVDVVPPSRFRPGLSRDLFRHYSVCTLSSHE
jgi:methyltransferase (TIGR00027 family)